MKDRTADPAQSYIEAYRYFSSDCPEEDKYHINSDNTVKRIISSIKTSERFAKMLLIGQSGCGKSSVLRQIIAEPEINSAYHPIVVSASDDMTLSNGEPIDILICIRSKLIQAMQKQQIEMPIRSPEFMASNKEIRHRFINRIRELEDHISDLCWTLSGQVHSGYRIDEAVLKKLGDEDISDNILSRLGMLKNQEYKSEFTFLRALESVIGELQTLHYKPLFLKHAWTEEKKEVLIVADNFNFLKRDAAEKLFFEGRTTLNAPDAKMIFAFPLSLWHYPVFSDLSSHFRCEWVRAINIYDAYGNYQTSHAELLKEIVLKRMDHSLISERAMTLLTEISGGILGELMRCMRDACIRAIAAKAPLIDEEIAKDVIHRRIDTYARLLDMAKYETIIKNIIRSKKKTEAQNKDLIDLLSYSFVLEYGSDTDKVWYDAHPCLTFDGKRL